MRILIINETWGMSGGQERYILQVGNGLTKRGHRVVLVFGKASGKTTDTSLANFETAWVKDLSVAGILKFAKDFGSEVIFLQNVYEPRLINLLAKKYPVTRFVHDHATYCPGNSKYFFNSQKVCPIAVSGRCLLNAYREKCMTRRLPLGVLRIWQRRAWLSALNTLPLVLCNSQYVKERLVQNGLAESKIMVNPLFPGQPGPVNLNPEVQVSNREKTILFVGRLFKEKGTDLLIRAITQVKVPVRVKIVGEGWARQDLVSLARSLGVSNCVEFLGFKGSEELVKLYSRCDIFVLPSVWPEPFGMVGLEAASFGKPVVAFNVGGISDWLKDGINGVLLHRPDADLLAVTLNNLLGNPKLCQKLGAQGRELARAKFNLERHLSILEQSFLKINK